MNTASLESGKSRTIESEVVFWLQSTLLEGADVEQHIETHLSHVFLTADHVYKLKKPLGFDFVDFRSLGAREKACRDELRLNRRLAPDVYLDVVPITRGRDGQLTLVGGGEIVDWLVKMRRLPQHLTLDALHHRGQLRPFHVDSLADCLTRFYQKAVRPSISPEAYIGRVLNHVLENRRSLLATADQSLQDAIDRAHAFQLRTLHLQPQLLRDRVEGGRIVDGHGDLRPEHICFTEPIAIFDCIEFNSEYRELDIADELAFLAAECEFVGAAWVGPRVFDRYMHQCGDAVPQMVVDFYKSYRACVRAKVAALRARQVSGGERVIAEREVRKHMEAADRYAAPYFRPLVLAVGGHSGSGKSTLADELAKQLSARTLSSDAIRQERMDSRQQPASLNAGRYSPEQRDEIYGEMFRRGSQLLGAGVSVVFDSTFAKPNHLHTAHDLARLAGGQFLAIECKCPRHVVEDRIKRRLAEGTSDSEATIDVYEAQVHDYQPWPAAIPQRRIDTNCLPAEQVRDVISALSGESR